MDLWSLGVMPTLVATAVRYNISFEMCIISKPVTREFCCNPRRWICGHLGRCALSGRHRAVQEQLKNVQQIQASHQAFAAIRGDGSVVTWGSANYGGDSSAVQDQLARCATDPSFNGRIFCNPWVMDLWCPGKGPGTQVVLSQWCPGSHRKERWTYPKNLNP